MHLHCYRLKNYRRMRDVRIELASDITIFVGANNSGKTSATHAIQAFTSKERLSIYDFSSQCWKEFDDLGNAPDDAETASILPAISLDLWFEVASTDLYLVIPLLPSTAWQETLVGIRIEFAAKNTPALLKKFREARTLAQQNAAALSTRPDEKYIPWPKSLSDFLKSDLTKEFEFKYYVLDRARFDVNFEPETGYIPLPLPDDPGGASILRSLVRVDSLSAQRHLADQSQNSHGSGRSEDLSKRLSRFYKRNLDQRQDDHNALRALFDSELGLDDHFATVFKDTLSQLAELGYPGLHNPKLEIKSGLNPATIMSSQDARVHYVVGEGPDATRLPDTYSGLGFKNLIYMVVEILDLHARWKTDENRQPLHLIFIEEPEAHLHAQLQQVFIRNVLKLMEETDGAGSAFHSQSVITTHSPHILYERGFTPIRYFKRQWQSVNGHQVTQVLNLSTFSSQNQVDRDFLQRYLKLTHCDLFFADAAILVEGNVERLLLPVMIEREAESLRSCCLSILEVGGAFGHRFRALIEFLGLVTLVITDLDSVSLPADDNEPNEDEYKQFEVPSGDASPPIKKFGKACSAQTPDALSSNQTLIQWLPKKRTIAELFNASEAEKSSQVEGGTGGKVRVTYQLPVDIVWNGETESLCGRTLEEAFALENAEWCQSTEMRHLGLKLQRHPVTGSELAAGLHRRVQGSSFDKTNFALAVLAESTADWKVPKYISEGLHWLREQVDLEKPVEPEVATVNSPVADAAKEETVEAVP